MFKLKQRKRKRRRIILSVLASIVVFTTVYALILPAITYTSEFTVNGSNAESEYTWSNDALAMSVTLRGNAQSNEKMPKNEDPVIDVELNGDAYEEWLEKYAESDDVEPLLVFKLHLYVGDTELDISRCTAEINLNVNSDFIGAATPMVLSADSGIAEGSQGDILAVIDSSRGEVASTVLSVNDDPVLLFTVNAGEPTALALESNPAYTIQHYLWFPYVVTSGNGPKLPFIDTTNTQNGTITKNPTSGLKIKNSSNLPILNVPLDTANGNKLLTQNLLIPLFHDEETSYHLNPQINYMNRLFNDRTDYNSNYTLTEVWIKPPDNANEYKQYADTDGFVKYKVPENEAQTRHLPERIRFTNNPSNTHITKKPNEPSNYTEKYPYNYTILIQEGMVVRLVFEVTEQLDYEREASFFDYDITDGNPQNGQYNAVQQGINNSGNYKGSGTVKYAFGNANTGTGLDTQIFYNDRNNYLNRYNRYNNYTVYQGCTFGMVQGLRYSSEDHSLPIFASSITAPDLFSKYDNNSTSENKVIGKTSYVNGEYSLGFFRQGGTYTLSYVKNSNGEKVVENLRDFVHPHSVYPTLWTNGFWPMDNSLSAGTDGHDPLFGKTAKEERGQKGLLPFVNSKDGVCPPSDDFKDHNSYFGMSYTVDFTIEPGYCGPLEYWFYGDDDMWVFLDKVDDPSDVPKLVADIGGIHSAVGEFVDLWDYIDEIPFLDENGNENTESETYRLTVLYTERGASGSTCYMRFTVPLDSNTTPPPERNDELIFEKVVLGKEGEPLPYDEDGQEFTFRLTLVTAEGVSYEDIYDYAVYRADTTPNHRVSDAIPVRSGTIGTKIAESGEYEFTLRNGEYIVVTGLPDDTHYTINEAAAGNYVTQYQKGNHYHVGDEQVNIFDGPIRYNHEVGNPYRINAEDYNLVRFINGSALKTEVDPGDGEGVQIGQNILYDIEWGNDRNTIADVTITDTLDEGVDFVGAAFKDREGNILGEWWYAAGDGYTNDLGSINYDSATRTVTWRLKHQESEATGVVTLLVRVNEKALAAETQPGKFGTTAPRVENQATIRIGNDHVIKTDIVENPVWLPIKTEVTPGQGKAVLSGKEITYTITWRNYLTHSAAVAVRDPLDQFVDYAAGSAKAYYRTEIDGMVVDTEIPNTSINYDPGGHTVYWDLGVQPSGAEGYVIFTVRVKESAHPKEIIWNWGYFQVGNKPEIETNHIDNPIIGYELPQTGGIGSIVFYISGAGIMSVSLISGYILWRKRRREET